MSGYEPRWDLDLAYGHAGERTVAQLLGLNDARVEVKTIRRPWPNLYVETHQYSRGTWMPSGIATSEADVWVFTYGRVSYLYPVDLLRTIAATCPAPCRRITYSKGDHPTRGVLIPKLWIEGQDAA